MYPISKTHGKLYYVCWWCRFSRYIQMLKCGHSQLVENVAAMTVSGTVAVVAYVPLKATVSEASEVSKVF